MSTAKAVKNSTTPTKGRPKRLRRDKVVQLMVFENEFDALNDAAAEAGYPLATWARAKLLELARAR